MTKTDDAVLMGVIGAPHGIRGELRVKTYTGDPLALGDYGPLRAADGRIFKILDIRKAKTVVVVRFERVNDRTAAEALNGVELFVDRAALPSVLEDDEFYQADLIGLTARDQAGELVGTVISVQNFGAGDLLELQRQRGPTVLIPFSRTAVPTVSIDRREIVLDPAAAGLVDEQEPGGA